MFGIIIECDLEYGYKYFIANPDVLDDDSIERWMLSTLTVNAALSNTISLKERILLENVPAGEEYLITIIDAMRLGRCIRIVNQRFGADSYENIVFRAFGWSPDYLRTLPFHHSQRKIAHTVQYADFSLDIIYRA